MRKIAFTLAALCAGAVAAACETQSQYDGVSRFANHNPATLPRDEPAPPLPDIPGRDDQNI